MRIIAGQFKGRKLFAPKERNVRPTSDRLREALFSIIGDKISGAKFLDLFAGCGAVGIEAKSRGAQKVVFVEISAQTAKEIRRNCNLVGMDADIILGDALKALSKERLGEEFDVIFADPPYEFSEFIAVLEKIAANRLLAKDGVVIYESSARIVPPTCESFQVIRQKRFGDAQLTFYQLS
ncbi:MAG: 16S rRNA (guanine(966)-N(2))-methyltransferase RsmD [candidate division KSB1 bacterium]|nr:16S rRNA (guanine(966)-N(2))-methyltransferase RsmD [candidate division KSB1 bacterium]